MGGTETWEHHRSHNVRITPQYRHHNTLHPTHPLLLHQQSVANQHNATAASVAPHTATDKVLGGVLVQGGQKQLPGPSGLQHCTGERVVAALLCNSRQAEKLVLASLSLLGSLVRERV